MRDASNPDIEYFNVIAAVKAGHLSEHEGFDYYKAFRDGDKEKVGQCFAQTCDCIKGGIGANK